MTQDEIICMALEAGFNDYFTDELVVVLERFASLVEQRVRSEIALEELTKQAQVQGEYK